MTEQVIYRMSSEQPNNPEVAILGGAGTIKLNNLKARTASRLMDITKNILTGTGTSSITEWKTSLDHLSHVQNDMETIIAAYAELEQIRSRGGKRSKGVEQQ
ncbi:Uncharacterised protein [uncultured archaeon]|nr:Uncharacterised protein [uncultured archaeon]